VVALGVWWTDPPRDGLDGGLAPGSAADWLMLAPRDCWAAVAARDLEDALADVTHLAERYAHGLDIGINADMMAESGLDLDGPAMMAARLGKGGHETMLRFALAGRVSDAAAFDTWAGAEGSSSAWLYKGVLIRAGGRDGAVFFRAGPVAVMGNSTAMLRDIVDNLQRVRPRPESAAPPATPGASVVAHIDGAAIERLNTVWPQWHLLSATVLSPAFSDSNIAPKSLTLSLDHRETRTDFDLAWRSSGDNVWESEKSPLAYTLREEQVTALWDVAWTPGRAEAVGQIVTDVVRQTNDPLTIARTPKVLNLIQGEAAIAVIETDAGAAPVIALDVSPEAAARDELAAWLPSADDGDGPYTVHPVGDTWYSIVEHGAVWLSPSVKALDEARGAGGDKDSMGPAASGTFRSAVLLNEEALEVLRGFLAPRLPDTAALLAPIARLAIEHAHDDGMERLSGSVQWTSE